MAEITWNAICEVNVSLSLSNRPLVVYTNTECVRQSIRFSTRALTSSAGSARSIALSNTTLNACKPQ